VTKKIVATERREPTCKSAVALLGNYLSGGLSPSTQAQLEHHFRQCPDCTAFLATYKKTIDIAKSFLQERSTRKAPLTLRLPPRIKTKTVRKSKPASF
jgi:anti-sigma factor RsiW